MNKKIKLELCRLDDASTFSLLGAFVHQARREWWQPEEIEAVTTEARDGNYDHLIATLSAHCETPQEGDKEW